MTEISAKKNMLIELRDVWKTYQTGAISLTALKGVNLDILSGEMTAIMGPSGSGKSTLMNILGCLDQKDQGTYKLNGTDISDLSQNELARIRNEEIGFVFQSFNLLSKLNLRDNVALPMVYAGLSYKERTARAMEALESVGLSEWARHKPNEVSGGQKQRAAIARAIVLQPALLMADEPTGNLASKSSTEIMQIFKRLNKEGSTIILITHDSNIAAYAQRTIHVFDGQITSDSLENLVQSGGTA